MRVPVLTYHSANIAGNDYANNDHIAFAEDLRLITDFGLRIVPVHWVVDQLLGHAERDLSGCVALTCDDGADYDYFDIDHPEHGIQRSLFNCLLDYRCEHGIQAQTHLHLTSFVIASPDARGHLDRVCLLNRGMRESWWRAANASQLMTIENHSWDHNHLAVPEPCVSGMARGSFLEVNDYERATAEIAAASRYLNTRLQPRFTSLFCYPFSHINDYLRTDYLPNYFNEHGMLAAFGDGATPVNEDSDRWNLPRYICGWHWKSPDGLRDILREMK